MLRVAGGRHQDRVWDLAVEPGLAGPKRVVDAPRVVCLRRVALAQLPGERHLFRVGVGDRHLRGHPVLQQLHAAPVGESGDQEPRHVGERGPVVERAGEDGGSLGDEAEAGARA